LCQWITSSTYLGHTRRYTLAVAGHIRVERITNDLTENTIKYSPGGDIRIFATPDNEVILVGTNDNGPGIAKKRQARLF
jgi:signal transduction histidine kinase